MRTILKSILLLPFSPFAFRGFVCVARALRLLDTSPLSGSSEITSILVAHPISTVGDLVLLIPFFEAIHRQWPKANLDVAVATNLTPFVELFPYIAHAFPYVTVRHKGRVIWRFREIRALISCYQNGISSNAYDLALAPRWGSDRYAASARYLIYLTGATRRGAYSAMLDGGDKGIDTLMTDIAHGGAFEQESVRNVRLLSRLHLIENRAAESSISNSKMQTLVNIAKKQDRDLLNRLCPSAPVSRLKHDVVLAPSASKPKNVWPAENFQVVIRELSQKLGLPFFIIGNKTDAKLCEFLAASYPEYAYSLGGKTSLPEMIGILNQASIFIGNDSGPGHFAASLGVPSIIINPAPLSCKEEHSHSAVRFRPCGPNVTVLQPMEPSAPCTVSCNMGYPHCITQISPSVVIAAVENILERVGSSM